MFSHAGRLGLGGLRHLERAVDARQSHVSAVCHRPLGIQALLAAVLARPPPRTLRRMHRRHRRGEFIRAEPTSGIRIQRSQRHGAITTRPEAARGRLPRHRGHVIVGGAGAAQHAKQRTQGRETTGGNPQADLDVGPERDLDGRIYPATS